MIDEYYSRMLTCVVVQTLLSEKSYKIRCTTKRICEIIFEMNIINPY